MEKINMILTTEKREKIAKQINDYLDENSKLRKFLIKDKINENDKKVFISKNGNEVICDSLYLLYRTNFNGPNVFIYDMAKVKKKEDVNNMKHIPTLEVKKTLWCSSNKTDTEIEYHIKQECINDFFNRENKQLIELVEVAYKVNSIFYNKNVIHTKSLKMGLDIANKFLKEKLNKENLIFNVLSSVNINNTDISKDITFLTDKSGFLYNSNKIFASNDFKGNCLYVLPPPKYVGVMPIIEDVYFILDKYNVIASYESGASILNPDNLFKIELEY
jgi:hypothetical protein